MVTDEQLKSYAESLPSIYREILTAFPRMEPQPQTGLRSSVSNPCGRFGQLPLR